MGIGYREPAPRRSCVAAHSMRPLRRDMNATTHRAATSDTRPAREPQTAGERGGPLVHGTPLILGQRAAAPGGPLVLSSRRDFPTPSNAMCKFTALAARFPDDAGYAEYKVAFLDRDPSIGMDR